MLIDHISSKAKFILLDGWYSDKENEAADLVLINSIQNTNNISLAYGGIEKEKIVYSEEQFTNAAHKTGHIFLWSDEKENAYIKSIYYDETLNK